jgi:signal transduction histidine kinase
VLSRRQVGTSAVFGDLAGCLRDMVGEIAREFEADAASIWLRDPNGGVRCVCHEPGQLGSSTAAACFKNEYRLAESVCLHSLPQTFQPVVLRDCAADPDLRQFWEPFSATLVETTLAVAIPGSARDEAEISSWCLLFYGQGRELGSSDIDRAAVRGRQLSWAIRVARAAAEGKESPIAAERKRIARELHDIFSQSFTAILLQIENGKALLRSEEKDALAALDQARDLARASLADIRRAIWAMRPRELDRSDLPVALEGLVRRMASASGIAAEFTFRGVMPPLTVEIETNLLRIIQEALTNALRHARPRRIHVHLALAGDFLKAWVEDDGCGFSLRDARSGGGFGLISMRERAESLSGKLLISSHPSRGTRVLIRIPLSKP